MEIKPNERDQYGIEFLGATDELFGIQILSSCLRRGLVAVADVVVGACCRKTSGN